MVEKVDEAQPYYILPSTAHTNEVFVTPQPGHVTDMQ